MARPFKEEEYTARRNAILDVAQRLIYTRGYEQMSVQDITNELQMSKGGFFHYFASKQTLLESLIERMLNELARLVTPITDEAHLPALEKLQRFFTSTARWETDQKPLI